ncbi:MAG TPA: hypothetical protein VH680_19110 [Gemmatimonadales bacterium]|jgi:hypothetical protein
MTKRSTAGLTAAALLIGTLACAGTGLPREEDTGAAPDTSDTQNPSGYRGMERDTSQVPQDSLKQPVDTFLEQQGTGVPADTAGYSGMETPDTTGAAAQDTSGAGMTDTTGTTGVDTSGTAGLDTSGTGVDTSGMSGMSDTTGQTSADSSAQQ